MKLRTVVTVGLGLLLLSAAPARAEEHPNLKAAHDHVKEAIEKLREAQKANEYDLGGHAAAAEKALAGVEKDIAEAVQSANAHDKKEAAEHKKK